MSLYSKLRGTIENIFQVGLGRAQLKALSTGELEVRNDADSAYAVTRVGTPIGPNDAVNKIYADTLSKPIIVPAQFDGSLALPANTAAKRFLVVSTTGGTAAIGEVLYDDGTATGNMVILAAENGRTIATTVSLSGGTVTFAPDSLYTWDADGSSGSVQWLLVSDVGNVTGGTRVIRYAITNAATQDSVTTIPANARVLRAAVEVTTPYSGGATITIGRAGSLALLQATTDNKATKADRYMVDQDTAWGGSALVVRTTIAGAPAAGAGVVVVEYANPDA